MRVTIKLGLTLAALFSVVVPAAQPVALAGTAPDLVDRPSIMQAQDLAHQSQPIALAPDVQRNGFFVRPIPRTFTAGSAEARTGTATPRALNNGGMSREAPRVATHRARGSGDFTTGP